MHAPYDPAMPLQQRPIVNDYNDDAMESVKTTSI